MKVRIRKESRKNRKMRERIRSRAFYSLAILGMAFVRHGSGRFVDLAPPLQRRLKKTCQGGS